LEALRLKLEKDFGKGIVVSGGTKSHFDTVSTGSNKFDKITDCGGIPVGKLIEIYGPESSGKSTLTLHMIAEFQKAGKKCLLCDYEYSFDKKYATEIGVDTDALLITQPNTMEDGYNIIYEYIKTGEIGLIVIDSHTAMVPKQRMDGEIGDAKMAPEARINSDGLKKIKAELEKSNCTVLGISQLRALIGGMGNGPKTAPTGGNAWKFYSDMRIKIYRELDKENQANKTTIEIVKNKCGKPFGKTQIDIAWGIGIDKIQEIIDLAVELGVVKKGGSWFTYNEVKCQGSNGLYKILEDNPELYEEIKKKTLDLYNEVELVPQAADSVTEEVLVKEVVNEV